MLYTFFTAIVFAAEIILFITILRAFIKADKSINNLDELVNESKLPITDIANLGKLISVQMVELSEDFKYRINKKRENFIISVLNKLLITAILMRINYKPIKKLRKSKFVKRLGKGLTLLQNMV